MLVILWVFIINIYKCLCISGVIWNKDNGTFVSIFSVKEFNFTQSTEIQNQVIEKHNFQRDKLHVAYFEENSFFQYYDNDEKVTGICGDIWTLLSEYLNFTLVLSKSKIKSFGITNGLSGNDSGLIKMLQKEETTIIPKMETYIAKFAGVDFTITLWRTHYRLYVHPHYQYKVMWMIDLLSWKIWCLLVLFYLSFSCLCIYLHRSYKLSSIENSNSVISSITDIMFYSFGIFCNQGDFIFKYCEKNSKLSAYTIIMLSWFVLAAYTSQILVSMTKTIFSPPFDSLETLYDTDYIILSEKNSVLHIGFQMRFLPIHGPLMDSKRIRFLQSPKEINELICSEDNAKYAIFDTVYNQKDGIDCTLAPVGREYYKTSIVAGINKRFKYKRALDIGIIKLHEYGIINALKARWLKSQVKQKHKDTLYAPISLNQVTLVICIYVFGFFTAIFTVIIENITYKQNGQVK